MSNVCVGAVVSTWEINFTYLISYSCFTTADLGHNFPKYRLQKFSDGSVIVGLITDGDNGLTNQGLC